MREELNIYPNIRRNIIFINGIQTFNTIFDRIKEQFIDDPEIGQYRDEKGQVVNWATLMSYGYPTLCWTRIMKSLIGDYIAGRLAVCTYKYPNARKIIIVHSYGCYAVAQALLNQKGNFAVDDLIFLGSVVDTNFLWNTIIEEGYVKNVFCYIGGRDWVQFFAYYFAGMGKSGEYGFTQLAKGKVRNIFRTNWGHNGYENGYEDFKKIVLGKYDEIKKVE